MNTWEIRVQGDDRMDDKPSRRVYKEMGIWLYTSVPWEALVIELRWILFQLSIRSVWFWTLCERFQVAAGRNSSLCLFSTVTTESCPNLEHCYNLSQILLLLRLLLAVLVWAAHLSLKSLTEPDEISSGVFNLHSLFRLFSETIQIQDFENSGMSVSGLLLPPHPAQIPESPGHSAG